MSDEAGFGIIEVLISALLVVIISVGVLAAVDAAGRTAATNKARGDASNLASQDQERLRSRTISSLAGLDETTTKTVDGRQYSIRSTGAYIVGTGEGDDCADNDNAPRYLKISSTVTWPGMTVAPVAQHSLRGIPNRSTEGRGSLAVDIDNAGGAGVSGVTVTITGKTTGTVTRAAATNSKGCVVFAFIPSGTYTVSFIQGARITGSNPGVNNVREDAVVADNAIASKSFLYDTPGTANVTYRVGTSSTTTQGNGFTVANAGWGANNTRSFSHSDSTTANSGAVLFPFSGSYEVWSGRCDENRPTTSSGLGSVTIPAGGSGSGDAREFVMTFRVQRRTNSSGTAQYGQVPQNDSKVTLVLTPSISGCTNSINRTSTGVSSAATGSTGTSQTGNYTTWTLPPLPWGTYDVCVAYNNGTSNRSKIEGTISNESVGTSANNTILTIPYNSTGAASNYTC